MPRETLSHAIDSRDAEAAAALGANHMRQLAGKAARQRAVEAVPRLWPRAAAAGGRVLLLRPGALVLRGAAMLTAEAKPAADARDG